MIAARAVGPASLTVPVRGQAVTLVAMADADRILWWEKQVMAAAERIRAAELAKRGRADELRRVLELILTADYSLVCQALKWSGAQVAELTMEERAQIIAYQDELNNTGLIAPLVAPIAQRTWLDSQ